MNAAALPRPAVYVASRASIPERSAMWRALRKRGANIISTWIDEAGAGETDDFTALWLRIQTEIALADRLVLYVEPNDFPIKGALIEIGIAMALHKPVWVLGKSITLDGRTAKPLGSWIHHPMVTMIRLSAIDADIELAVGLPLALI